MTRRAAALFFLVLFAGLAGVQAQETDAARRWRLHCALVGGDLSEPAGVLLFRRCLASQPPASGGGVVVDPFAKNPLVTNTPVDLVDGCPEGRTPRGAAPDDKLCVPRAVRERTLRENAAAASHAAPGGERCLPGFVWREATKSDHVCVEPAARAQAALDNSARP